MAEKKQITVNLDEKSIEKLDTLCSKLDMNRAQVLRMIFSGNPKSIRSVSYTHLRAHETRHDLVCRLLLEKKKKNNRKKKSKSNIKKKNKIKKNKQKKT